MKKPNKNQKIRVPHEDAIIGVSKQIFRLLEESGLATGDALSALHIAGTLLHCDAYKPEPQKYELI